MALFFHRGGGGGIWVTTRQTKEEPWGEAVKLGPTVNSSAEDGGPSISADGLMLFFGSLRPGGNGMADIWVTMRATTDGDWGTPVNLGPLVNSSSHDASPSISADGSTLFFWSGAGGFGLSDVWRVSIEPVVDFNGDEIVDAADMCIMVDYWGTKIHTRLRLYEDQYHLLIFVKQMELINSQKTYILPLRAPPNKFEGATPGSINNAKLNNT